MKNTHISTVKREAMEYGLERVRLDRVEELEELVEALGKYGEMHAQRVKRVGAHCPCRVCRIRGGEGWL